MTEMAQLASLDCPGLVDRLLPNDEEWAKPLREAAVLILDRIETPQELFDALRIQITQPEMPEEGNFVKVMSLHKSKGLTNKVTIVTGCIEGLIPTTDSSHTPLQTRENLEEQRRLFYVAMTRCREILVLSSIRQLPIDIAYRMGARIHVRQNMGNTIASRFLGELGPSTPNSVSGNDWINRNFS